MHLNGDPLYLGIKERRDVLISCFGGILKEQENDQIIMVGDFNDDIKTMQNPFKISYFGNVRDLYLNTTQLNTCCNLNGPIGGNHYDHILDSKAAPLNIKIPNYNKPASDHAPVLAELIEN